MEWKSPTNRKSSLPSQAYNKKTSQASKLQCH
jgi:hypothetical protein